MGGLQMSPKQLKFKSSTTPEGSCYIEDIVNIRNAISLNPQPPRRVVVTDIVSLSFYHIIKFKSSTTPEGSCYGYFLYTIAIIATAFKSSTTPEGSCYLT